MFLVGFPFSFVLRFLPLPLFMNKITSSPLTPPRPQLHRGKKLKQNLIKPYRVNLQIYLVIYLYDIYYTFYLLYYTFYDVLSCLLV